MKESVFSGEVVKTFLDEGHWAYKIMDFPTSQLRKTKGTMFNTPKPFDIIALVNHYGIVIEAKQFKKFESFGIRHLRPAQLENMDRITDSKSGRCFVFLNIRIQANKASGIARENRLYIFPWEDIRDRLTMLDSIKAKELKEMPYLIGKKGKFPLEDFCEEITNNSKGVKKYEC